MFGHSVPSHAARLRKARSKLLVRVAALVVALLAMLGSVGRSSATSFSVESVNNSVIWWPSLAVDANGDAHAAFYHVKDYSAANVAYQRRHDGVWSPPENVSTWVGSHVSLALDPSGEPHIAYYDHRMNGPYPEYATRTSGGWESEPIDGSGLEKVGSMALAFDPLGRPHVAYFWQASILKHAVRDNGVWITDVIDPNFVNDDPYDDPYDDPNVSIAVDSQGGVWVAYHRGETLVCARQIDGAWASEEVNHVTAAYSTTAIALRADGEPTIAFSDASYNLVLAHRQADTWTPEIVVGGVGNESSLAFDAAGNPHLSFQNASDRNLGYASRANGSWSFATADETPGSGTESSLAVDAAGQPTILFKFKQPYSGPGALRYANGASAITGIGQRPASSALRLAPPSPNPATRGRAIFAVDLPRAELVTLELYDVAGHLVVARSPEALPAGSQRLTWDTGTRAPGLYFVRLRTASGADAEQRWVVMK